MKKSFLFLLFATFALLMIGCSSATSEEEPAGGEAGGQTEETQETPAEPQPLSVTFDCQEIRGPEEGAPLSSLSVVVNGNSTFLDSVMVCAPIEPGEYDRYEIPSEALAACGGWFAGAGDYFYALEEEGTISVMAGWQDEMQDDDGFHYEEKKRFPVSDE